MCLLQVESILWHSSKAIETVEKPADRRSVDKACKFKKRALETEEEALERKSLNRACVAKKRVLVCVDLKVAFKEMLHKGTELKNKFQSCTSHTG